MSDTTTPPEVIDDLVRRLQRADEYEPLDHDGWAAADAITALRADVERLTQELSEGSFYKESDIDALQARAETAEAERDRLRAALEEIAKLPNRYWQRRTARAALDKK